MKQINKTFACILLAASASMAYASDIVRIDPSQSPKYNPDAVATQPPPNGVNSHYKPYCGASGAIIGMYIPAATYLTYNASGVLTTITETDGASGVSGTNTFASVLTYSGSNLASSSCPAKQ